MPPRRIEIFSNYLVSLVFISTGLLFLLWLTAWPYTPVSLSDILQQQLHFSSWQFYGVDVLIGLYVVYLIGLLPYYFTLPAGHLTKSKRIWRMLWERRRPEAADAVALRALAVKLLFIPQMAVWGFEHLGSLCAWIEANQTAWAMLHLIGVIHLLFTLDVGMFLFGYCVEHPRLGNEIKSVDPTLTGWLAALVCYVPLRQFAHALVGDNPGVPIIEDPRWQAIIWLTWLGAFAIYLWATLALNVRASNLTNRGIVASGPYRWVRHPAYVSKNLAWWITTIVLVITSPVMPLHLIGVSAVWSLIYFLRAVTEERHLSNDPDYQRYCLHTPYRFIPGVV